VVSSSQVVVGRRSGGSFESRRRCRHLYIDRCRTSSLPFCGYQTTCTLGLSSHRLTNGIRRHNNGHYSSAAVQRGVGRCGKERSDPQNRQGLHELSGHVHYGAVLVRCRVAKSLSSCLRCRTADCLAFRSLARLGSSKSWQDISTAFLPRRFGLEQGFSAQ
jgi:hypothetical protein